MIFEQNLLEMAYFIAKMTDFWKAPLVLVQAWELNPWPTALQASTLLT